MTEVNHGDGSRSRRERLMERVDTALMDLEDFWVEVARPWIGTTWEAIQEARPRAETVPEAYRSQMREIEQDYGEALDSLTSLDAETRTRIRPAITSAAISLNMRQGWAAAVDDLIEDHFLIASGLFYVSVGFFAVSFFSENFVITPTGWSFLWTMFLTLLVQALLRRIWNRLEVVSTRLELLGRLIALVGLLVLTYTPSLWQPTLDRWLRSAELSHWLTEYHVRLDNIQLDICILDAMVILVSFGFFPLAMRLALAVLQKLSPNDPRDILACARVAIEFLDIAVALQELVDPVSEEPVEPKSQEQVPETGEPDSCAGPSAPRPTIIEAVSEVRDDFPMVRPYIIGFERRTLLVRVERLAQFIEGPWRRTIHSGDRAADRSVDQLATGIAAALRRWKPNLAIGGSKLDEMRHAFATAVLNIAEGEWDLLAIEAPSRQSPGHRAIRFIRRTAALSIVLGALYIVLMPPVSWRSHVSGLLPEIWIGAGLLALALDPTVSERFGLLSKVTTVLPSGK